MSSDASNITFDISQNPKLKEVFSAWKPGKNYKLTLSFQFMSMDLNEATGSLNKVEVHSDGEDKVIEPEPEKPIAITMRGSSDEVYS